MENKYNNLITSISLPKETREKIDQRIKNREHKNRSAYIKKAIEHYENNGAPTAIHQKTE
jgi:metal-responsive CopG/Arc/MetJ family transcriptional regulator